MSNKGMFKIPLFAILVILGQIRENSLIWSSLIWSTHCSTRMVFLGSPPHSTLCSIVRQCTNVLRKALAYYTVGTPNKGIFPYLTQNPQNGK